MRVFYITNMYPCKEKPSYGIFIKDEVDAMRASYFLDSRVFLIKGFVSRWKYLSSIPRIHRIITLFSPDIIHVHYGLSGLFSLILPYTVPIVVTFHGGDIQSEMGRYFQNFISCQVAQRASHLIVVNENMRRLLKTMNHNVSIIPCGVDTNFFRPKSIERKRSENAPYRIIFPSNPNRPEKDYALFSDIVNEARLRHRLPIVEIHLKDVVRSHVPDLFNHADCLLLTSRSEGSPQVIKEAMAVNLPIVSTDVGDVKHNLRDLPGTAIIPRDAKIAADALAEVLRRPRKLFQGRERLQSLGLDQVSICKKIIRVYHKVLREKK